ncbi:DUF5689 domain-containing protein [Abyssalbus ytuae]|uniref:DUF5689 domain-containing protein n=1 Tax=Abyssalbus ytuae TaxID=2926907 RepID=A0A9E6ZQM0_9FLAO|nr:DUF5689 domain-containing protein [Abyssalbus ytuae]UOB19129.1 DUF5689 domain-containing protein [Abyssalbus ytuae]
MRKTILFIIIFNLFSCVENKDFNIPDSICNNELKPNTTLKKVKELYQGEIMKITDDLIIEGYVISSDKEDNFFGSLHIQDNYNNPTEGIQIEMDIRDSHLFYRPGERILIRLKGLYIDESSEVFKIGSVYTNAGGSFSVGRLPVNKVKEHLINTCDEVYEIEPKQVSINELDDTMINTLIQLNHIEFVEEDLGKSYAEPLEETQRTLINCDRFSIKLVNSGYSDFQNETLPAENGNIVGVLGKYRNSFNLTMRYLSDVNLTNERCNSVTNARVTDIKTVRNLYADSDLKIEENIKIKGVVISDASSNNISPNKIIIQDETAGIEVNFVSSHSLSMGDEVELVLLGVDLFNNNNSIQLNNVPAKSIISVNEGISLSPLSLNIEEALSGNYESRLIKLEGVQFAQQGGIYSGIITLTNCSEKINVITSAEASFANEEVNDNNGTITGILRIDEEPYLHLRNVDDINFDQPYIDCYADDAYVFISELADPDNNSAARFVELYNSSEKEINLQGWQLRRYTNANTEVSSTIDLSGHILQSHSTLIIAANLAEFQTVYGFAPDIEGKTNSPADSNGDDNIELVNSIGTVIDVFGIPGEDGSNTNHEFEDGRAVRNPDIIKGNPVYTFSEWTVFNDSGNAGTIKIPQQAPNDFSPGVR